MQAGRELDALVAEKVMGWTRTIISVESGDPTAWHTGDANRPVRAHWHPSTDIAAALPIFEKFAVEERWSLSLSEKGWEICNFPDEDLVARADTAPLAICLAALKTVEGR